LNVPLKKTALLSFVANITSIIAGLLLIPPF